MSIKRTIVYLGLILAVFCAANYMNPAHADEACDIAGVSDPLICGTPDENEELALQNTVKNVLEVVYLWIGIIAVVFIVIGGIKYMTSAGDTNKVQSAKNTITYSVVGLVVVLAAFAITEFFIGALEGRTSSGDAVVVEGGGGSEGEATPVRAISTIKATRMAAGQSMSLRVRYVPDYATDKQVTWKSSNPAIVSVDSSGNIKALKEGTATITATSTNGKTSTTTVTVLKKGTVVSGSSSSSSQDVISLTVDPTKLTLKKGEVMTVKTKISPNSAKDKSLTWSSNKPKIVGVDPVGHIIAKKDGKATITVKSANGKKAKIKVTVNDWGGDGEPIKVNSELLDALDYYHQGQWTKTVSCLNTPKFSYVGQVSCGLSTYMAGAYALTHKKVNYMNFAEEACSTGFFNGSGASWERVHEAKFSRKKYEKKYKVKGQHIANTWASVTKELKIGHPVAYMVKQPTKFTGGNGHFILILSYRVKDGVGQVYVWNPNKQNEGWHDKATFESNVSGSLRNDPGCLPWAMSKV